MKNLTLPRPSEDSAAVLPLKKVKPTSVKTAPKRTHLKVDREKLKALSNESSSLSAKPQTCGTLKDWHPDEQPRERLVKHGAAALATSELLAILLRTGTAEGSACDVARELFHSTDGQLRVLASREWRDLARTHGIGKVKAVTLVAALELGRRQSTESDQERPIIQTSSAAFDILGPLLRDLPHEECWMLLLNNARRLIGTERLSTGGLDATVVDVRQLMATALRHNATAFVVAHNHPSGGLNPSEADISLTRQLVEAGNLLRIPMQDHLIVAGRRYYSFRDSKKLCQ